MTSPIPSETFGLERYRKAMLATAALLYPPPPLPEPPKAPVPQPERRAYRKRMPARAHLPKPRKVAAPAGYMFIGPYAVPIGSRVTIAEIQAQVAEHYDVAPIEMTSKRQGHKVAHPRQAAMYLAKQLTSLSLPEIGRRFGGRDHTTVIHAIRAVEHRRASDPKLDRDIRSIRARLRGGA